MDNITISDYLEGRATAEEVQQAFWNYIDKEIEEYVKNHHLQFEISVAWNDDDEFEHEGYYDNVDDAIEALMKYKKIEEVRKNFQKEILK